MSFVSAVEPHSVATSAPDRAALPGAQHADLCGTPGESVIGALSRAEVDAVRRRLTTGTVPESDADRIDLLRALEELKAAATATQASVALEIDATARSEDAGSGVPSGQRGRDVPMRLAMALRESPARARSFLGAARAWHTEMPHTLTALRAGRLNAWRATVLVKETAHLSVQSRGVVDARLCSRPGVLEGVGTKALTARVKKLAAELDPAACAQRARRAESERSVWIRPAPDTMSYVTALLPVAQGVGVYAALRQTAEAARAHGDPRTRGQVMADTFVERLTGQPAAQAVPMTVNLVVSDATLLGAGHEPALLLDAHGTAPAGPAGVIPAQVARNLVANALDADAAWLRRLYTDPTGDLVAASSTRRFFADALATMLRVRDQGLCRTPYCDAPIRHTDHVEPAGDGGPTTLDNGQGLCEACNLAKDDERVRQADEHGSGRHTVITTTSTGHRYRSTAPPLPRPAASGPRDARGSPLEHALIDHLEALRLAA